MDVVNELYPDVITKDDEVTDDEFENSSSNEDIAVE